MNTPQSNHSEQLHSFERKLTWLLMSRAAMHATAIWFFAWGVVILVGRTTHTVSPGWLQAGLLGFIPCAVGAAIWQWRRRPRLTVIRAAYDEWNKCGGMVMAEEAADMSQWKKAMPASEAPRLHWRSGRALGLFGASALFVAITLALPERFASFAAHRPLEIGQLVEQLNAEVELLKEEKILEETKATEFKKELSRLNEESSGIDPNKTWEALDHIKESNSALAKQAAEEALAKMTSLTEAEALAAALQTAVESGLGEATATEAAQHLSSLLKMAKLDEGLLKGEISPELLKAAAAKLSPEDLEKLLKAIQFNKERLSKAAAKLAQLKLIDAELLGRCKAAGQCPNTDALAAFLKECEGEGNCDGLAAAVMSYCRGGINRGRGDAPMTWTEGSSEEGVAFKEETLPPSMQLQDSQFVGASRSAPELTAEDVTVEHGALNAAQAGAGAAHAQTVLPRHRKAVSQYFKREE